MANQPVAPMDPMGSLTDKVGRGYPGPGPIGQFEGFPPYEVEVHALPWSDKMSDPYTRADMMQPSTSATMIVEPWWRTAVNVIADGHGIPSLVGRYGGILPVQNQAIFTGNWERSPNTVSGVPSAPRMSDLAARFQSYLAQVQGLLLGAP